MANRAPSISKAVIPAAGLGTRLRPATKAIPKEMLPIGRQPVLQHVYDELALFGVQSVLVITSDEKRAIEDHFGDDSTANPEAPKVFYACQSVPKGLGHAIAMARDYADDRPFVVALGDSTLGASHGRDLLERMEQAFLGTEAEIAIAVQRVPRKATSRYGIVVPQSTSTGEAFLIDDIVEKPDPEKAPSTLAVAARYIFRPSVFEFIERTAPGLNGEIQITDAIRLCVREGNKVCCVPLREDERRYDVGDFESYYQAFIEFALNDEEVGEKVRDFVRDRLTRSEPVKPQG